MARFPGFPYVGIDYEHHGCALTLYATAVRAVGNVNSLEGVLLANFVCYVLFFGVNKHTFFCLLLVAKVMLA